MKVTKWTKVKVGDIGDVFTGKTPSTKCPEYFGNDFFFITPRDMHQGKHVYTTERGLSTLGANLLRRIQLPPKSLCVSCIGWQMGEAVMTSTTSFTNQQINSIVPNNNVDADFLYYSFVPRKQELLSIASATGVRTPIMNKSDFCNLQIMLPPISTQQKIAAMLSAYDGLIENNAKRIKILEEMAQTIYNEWFVKFRFPGYENVKMVESELGMIPEGWEVKKLGELCVQMQSGGTPSRKKDEFWNAGEINWYKTMELWDKFLFNSEEKITNFGLKGSSARLYEPGTVLMAIYGSPTVGRLGILTQQATCNQAALGMVANPSFASQQYLFYTLYNLRGYFNSIAQGAAQQNISKAKVAEAECVLPPKDIMEFFTNHIVSIWGLLLNLQKKNNKLRVIRDLLLPRLISGEIDVSELDIDIGGITE